MQDNKGGGSWHYMELELSVLKRLKHALQVKIRTDLLLSPPHTLEGGKPWHTRRLIAVKFKWQVPHGMTICEVSLTCLPWMGQGLINPEAVTWLGVGVEQGGTGSLVGLGRPSQQEAKGEALSYSLIVWMQRLIHGHASVINTIHVWETPAKSSINSCW